MPFGYTLPPQKFISSNYFPDIGAAQTNALNREVIRTSLDQSKQLFPYQLEEAQTKGLLDSININKVVADIADSNRKRILTKVADALSLAEPQTAATTITDLQNEIKLPEKFFRTLGIYEASGTITERSLKRARQKLGVLSGKLKTPEEIEQEVTLERAKKGLESPEGKRLQDIGMLEIGSPQRLELEKIQKLEIDKLQTEALNKHADQLRAKVKDSFDKEEALRDNYARDTKQLQTIAYQYGVVNKMANLKTGIGDIGIIRGILLMFEPNSVVREGEFASAEAAAGAYQQARVLFEKWKEGDRLTDTARKQFLDAASGVWSTAQNRFDVINKQYDRLSKNYGLDFENVRTKYEAQPDSQEFQPNAQLSPGSIYEDASGRRMRFEGYDAAGKPVWREP